MAVVRAPRPGDPVAAEDVRSRLRERGAFGRCSSLSDQQIVRVVEHVKGLRWLAAEALAMRPWPTWMVPLLFPRRTSKP